MAKFLLTSESNAQAIDRIVHPAVFKDFKESGLQWMESALMFESGIYKLVDKVVAVVAPKEIRIHRVMERDHISREKVLEWMNRQMDQKEIITQGRLRHHQRWRNRYRSTIRKYYKTMQQIILAIAGKPGLYKLVSRGNNNLIVEALDGTHKRMPAFATERITSLNDIAMFTETDDVPLMDVLENLKNLENGQKASINEKKASGEELRAYFSKVLPEWDQDRVQNSHIKKLITWYNILVEAGLTDFKDPEEAETAEEK